MYTSLGNLTTHITIANNAVGESGAIIMDFSHFTFAETSDKQDSDDANVVQPSAKNQQPAVSIVLMPHPSTGAKIIFDWSKFFGPDQKFIYSLVHS